MEFSVLGPLEIRADSGGEVTAPVLRRLAAYLLSRAGEQVPAETVAAALRGPIPQPPGRPDMTTAVLAAGLGRFSTQVPLTLSPMSAPLAWSS